MVLVKHILEGARERLAVLPRDALVRDAAAMLSTKTPLVVICDHEGVAVGVIFMQGT